jgi:hypothetical protein
VRKPPHRAANAAGAAIDAGKSPASPADEFTASCGARRWNAALAGATGYASSAAASA